MAEGGLGQAFIPYYNQLMHILSTNGDLKKSANGILKHAAYGGFATTVGGVVGGRLGCLIGGIVGLVIGYMLSDDYDSMITVLKKMPDSEKERLVQKVQKLVGDIGIDVFTRFIGIPANREDLLHLIQDFTKIRKEDKW